MAIQLLAPINTVSYGYVSTNILHALTDLGEEVCLFPIALQEVDNAETLRLVEKCIENGKFKFSWSNPSIRIWHQNGMAEHIGSPRIGFPIFELDKFHEIEIYHLKSLDHIFVASKWAKDVVLNNIPEASVSVIPLGVNTKVFKPARRLEFPNSPFRVLVAGKAEYRKGHDIAPDILKKAFEGKDYKDVEIYVMIDNHILSSHEMDEWKSFFSSTGLNIKFIPRLTGQYDVANLYNEVDCGLFMSRAEGWNMPALEMLACGKRIVITNYSAHTEYCTNENSYLVDVDETELAYDGKFFQNGVGDWAKIGKNQIDQAVEHLRMAYMSYMISSGYSVYENDKGIETAKQFSWENTAKEILCYLKKN
jgi:glycosyltransferase involved in cell wall biosynthesis